MNADLLLRCSDYGEGIKNECSNAINSASYAHIAVDVPNALNHLLLSLRLFSQVFLSAFLCQAGVFLSAFRPLPGFIKAKKAPYKDANLVYPYKMDGDVLSAHTEQLRCDYANIPVPF